MLFLSKILPIFVLPVGVTLLLLLFSLLSRKRWPAVVAAAILYISSTGVVSSTLLRTLESRYPPVPIARAGTADAIIVLSGIFGPQTKPGELLNFAESIERLEGGIALHQTRAAPWIVFTGGRIPWEHKTHSEGELSRKVAIARGIPANQIIVTREVGNTADEAEAVAELMRSRGWKRVILVTTAWHMPRAAWLFHRANAVCTTFPVDFRTSSSRRITPLHLLPNAGALVGTETALREIYGNLFYRIFR